MTDARIKMEPGKPVYVADPESGELLIVERDDRYDKFQREFWGVFCKHVETIIMRVPLSNGSIQVRNCCTHCGERVGNSLPHGNAASFEQLPLFSGDTQATYTMRRNDERHSFLLNLARTQYAERGKFTKFYRQYLKSPEWQAKRDLVFKRCGGICEGCGIAAANQAHHVTYEHFGNEFLFELLGLCSACHDRVHANSHPHELENGDDSDDVDDGDFEDDELYFEEPDDIPFGPLYSDPAEEGRSD